MASYDAVINVQVKNSAQLKQLRGDIDATATSLQAFNRYQRDLDRTVNSLNEFSQTLRTARGSLNDVSVTSRNLVNIAREYVDALEAQEAAQRKVNKAVSDEQALRRRQRNVGVFRQAQNASATPTAPGGRGRSISVPLTGPNAFQIPSTGRGSPISNAVQQRRFQPSSQVADAWRTASDQLREFQKDYQGVTRDLITGQATVERSISDSWRRLQLEWQEYNDAILKNAPRSPVGGRVGVTGSPADIIANAPRQPVGGGRNIPGSPLQVRAERSVIQDFVRRNNQAEASIDAFKDQIREVATQGRVSTKDLDKLETQLRELATASRAAVRNPELNDIRERRRLSGTIADVRSRSRSTQGKFFRGNARDPIFSREAAFTGIQGAAFPLLFGQGLGAATGGGLGGILGGAIGGNAGFALSAAFTTVGASVDQLTNSLGQLGKALDEPTAALQSLEFLGQAISKDTKAAVQYAQSIGDAAGAAAILDAELRKAFGPDGVKGVQAYREAQKELEREFARLTGSIVQELIPVLVGITPLVVGFTSAIADLIPVISSFLGGTINAYASVADRLDQAGVGGLKFVAPAFGIAQELRDSIAEAQERINRQSGTSETSIGQFSALQSLETAEADRRQREDAARALSRQAEDLARGRVDLERRVGDLRLEFLDQIQRKEEELARSRVELERQSAQIAIEARDQRLEELGFNSRGVGRELVDAVRQYLRTRDEGEADLRQKEKLFQIDTQRRQLELERIKLQNTRKIDDLQRASADYQRQVEDYKIQVARYQFDAAVKAARVTEQAVQQASIGPMSQVQGVNRLGSSAYPPTSERGLRWGRMHYGRDYGAGVGTPISTTLGGVVKDVGSEPGYGNYVEVQLENGVKAFWAHLSEVVLKEGQKFNAGTLIAKTGNTGRSTGPHLHSGDRNINEALSDPYTRLGGQVIAHSHTMESIREQASRINVPNLPTPPTFSPVSTQVASPNATLADLGAGATSVGRELFDAAKQIQGLTNSREFNQLLRVLDNDGSADLGQRKQATRELEAQFFASTGITENERAIQELTARRASQLEDQTQLYADVIERLREEGVWQTIGAEKTEEILNTVEQRLENEKLITDELIRQQKAQQAKGLLDSANRLRGEAQFTGTGISRFGFGRGRQEFESAKLRDATDELAEDFGKLGELLEKQNQAIADSQQLAGTISDAFKNAITVAIAGGDTQQVVAAAFASLGDKFLEIAFRPLEDVIARQLFELFEVDPAKLQEQMATLELAASATFAAKSLTATATAATQLTANITSAKASAGIGDALSAAGIFFPAPLGLGRAFGGFVAPGNAYPVGENGPELFVPGESGTIVDDPFADVNAGLGGQPNLAEISSGDSGPGPVQVDYSGAVLNFNGSEYVSKEDVPRIVDQAVKQSYGYTQNRLRSRPGDRRKLGMS